MTDKYDEWKLEELDDCEFLNVGELNPADSFTKFTDFHYESGGVEYSVDGSVSVVDGDISEMFIDRVFYWKDEEWVVAESVTAEEAASALVNDDSFVYKFTIGGSSGRLP